MVNGGHVRTTHKGKLIMSNEQATSAGILLQQIKRKPDRGTKQRRLLETIAMNMKLFVVIQESLRAANAEDTPLFEAVRAQAQLCGALLPNSMRLEREALEKISSRCTLTEEERAKLDKKPLLLNSEGRPV